MFDYPVNVRRETGSVWISSDDVPEISGAGDDEEAAMLDGIDGLESALCLYVERRRLTRTLNEKPAISRVFSSPPLPGV